MPTKVLSLELGSPETSYDVTGYSRALVVVRWRGIPLGTLEVAATSDSISVMDVFQAAYRSLNERIIRAHLNDWLSRCSSPSYNAEAPVPVSVVICTRNRTTDLKKCLDSLAAMDPQPNEIVIVDNAPSNDETSQLCRSYKVRYALEQRPGLNRARCTGSAIASHEIILFTDDDVNLDRNWVAAMTQPFQDPGVGAVTGLVLPVELETDAQELFEKYGGFGRGFERRRFGIGNFAPIRVSRIGAGASMAFRRSLVENLGLFESDLDCGTPAKSGGDHYAFYRLLTAGYAIVYTPAALCWHRHRRTMKELTDTLYGYGVGGGCFLLRCIHRHGEMSAVLSGLAWCFRYHVPQLAAAALGRPDTLPASLIWAELRGLLAAPRAYMQLLRREKAIGARTA